MQLIDYMILVMSDEPRECKLGDYQDCCNKMVPIYVCRPWTTMLSVMKYYYKAWFEGSSHIS